MKKKTRNSTQRLTEYVGLTAQVVVLVCALADISGPLPLSAKVLAVAVLAARLRR